ncbi:MAG: cobalt ABC transporter ATP-binding protein [Chloroflexi bacterium 44-23]|nr:MAG: cobalt ABC transporter ATP-binding protein [Chloroflexi bacterium 44-23]
MIEIKDLSFSYPDGKRALSGINLTVYSDEKIALIGANGAGKSTLFLHLNGLLNGEGQISVKSLPLIKKNLAQIRAVVGVVFQNPDDQLFSPTVFEDVAYGPLYQGLDQQTIRTRVERALCDVGLSGFSQRNPYHLSNGEKKRVAIASVLSMQPQILVLDEPTAGLDPRARRELIALLSELPQTMLIATHDLELARQLTPRTVLMNAGSIIADGSTDQILEDKSLLLEYGLL